MHKFSVLIAGLVVFTFVAGVGQSSHLLRSQAEGLCSKRAHNFAETIRGKGADHPDDYLIREHYRSCVFANSGFRPSQKLNLQRRVLFRLNSMGQT